MPFFTDHTPVDRDRQVVNYHADAQSMQVTRRITQDMIDALGNYPWLASNFPIGAVGTIDGREVARLLENLWNPNAEKVLSLMDRLGDIAHIIVMQMLAANDGMNFTRHLYELFLFDYLIQNSGVTVRTGEGGEDGVSPDMIVTVNDCVVILEIYSPSDFYGYEVFDRYLTPVAKGLDVEFGYNLEFSVISEDPTYPVKFPEYKTVQEWLGLMRDSLTGWIRQAAVGQGVEIDGPNGLVRVRFMLRKRYEDRTNRSVYGVGASRATDTSVFFERDDPRILEESPWVPKLKSKLSKQQAGKAMRGRVRLFMLNFALTDSSDYSYLREPKAIRNLLKIIGHAAKGVDPFPPYDVVVPCVLGFECGFSDPAILALDREPEIRESLALLHLNEPIRF